MPVNTVPNGGTGFVTGERIRLNRVRNLPLILTLFRLALGPIFLFSVEVGPWLMSVIVAMAIVTDWLDGFLARRWKAVSVSGKLLDPFADALFCMMAFWACWRSPLAILSGWLFGVLVGREALVTFVVRPVALLRGTVISASMTGKVKTCFQFGVIVTFIVLQIDVFKELPFLIWLARVGFYAVLALSLVSAGIYTGKVVVALRGRRGAEEENAT